MLYNILALSLITLFVQHSLFSMDNPISQDPIIENINNIINREIKSQIALFQQLTGLLYSESDCYNIIKATEWAFLKCNVEATEDRLNTLYNQNHFVAKALDYYTERASENINKVTLATIQTIKDSANQQFIVALNTLSPSIKKFVMDRALQKINYTYDIVLNTDKNIMAFDICESTHQVIISTRGAQKHNSTKSTNTSTIPNQSCSQSSCVTLWNLTNGREIRTPEGKNIIQEKKFIFILAFHPKGSSVAGALYDENTVKIWNPKTGEALYNLPFNHDITHLDYTHPTYSIISGTCYYNSLPITETMTTSYVIEEIKVEPGTCTNCSYTVGGRRNNSQFNGEIYQAEHPINYIKAPLTQLHITKIKCPELLLYDKAIKNTQKLINESKIYLSPTLTSTEQQMIHTAIAQKNKKHLQPPPSSYR